MIGDTHLLDVEPPSHGNGRCAETQQASTTPANLYRWPSNANCSGSRSSGDKWPLSVALQTTNPAE
jgi:hypothetical protein